MGTHIYERGFLITNDNEIEKKNSSFFTNGNEFKIDSFNFVYSKNVNQFHTENLFVIGHAYNPVRMIDSEVAILNDLANSKNKNDFFQRVSELTGLFLIGKIEKEKVILVGDAAGMQCVFYGYHKGKLYITSHTHMFEDICGVTFDAYIKRLINYRFYPLFGKQLPGDMTPYHDFKRLIPNHYVELHNDGTTHVERFFPIQDYKEYTREEVYKAEILIAKLIHNNLELISKKWLRPAISMTGGCDSKTTLACANGLYDRFSYFSYVSNNSEKVDAEAAHKICDHLGLFHTIYNIPSHDSCFSNIEDVRKALIVNSGCIGKPNTNDVRKRAYFATKNDFDIEVKSWVSECGRAYYNKRFLKKRFSKQPTPRHLSTLYKVFLTNRVLAKETDKVFDEYQKKYLTNGLKMYPWHELFFWEFRMSSWNGLVITAEHKYSFDITIPYNNRIIIDSLLRMPLEYRIKDKAYKDIRQMMNPQVDDAGVSVTNLKHTKNRAKLEKLYFEVMTRFPF